MDGYMIPIIRIIPEIIFVDFGIYDGHREIVRDFVNGYERSILLDFNVDGYILDNKLNNIEEV